MDWPGPATWNASTPFSNENDERDIVVAFRVVGWDCSGDEARVYRASLPDFSTTTRRARRPSQRGGALVVRWREGRLGQLQHKPGAP